MKTFIFLLLFTLSTTHFLSANDQGATIIYQDGEQQHVPARQVDFCGMLTACKSQGTYSLANDSFMEDLNMKFIASCLAEAERLETLRANIPEGLATFIEKELKKDNLYATQYTQFLMLMTLAHDADHLLASFITTACMFLIIKNHKDNIHLYLQNQYIPKQLIAHLNLVHYQQHNSWLLPDHQTMPLYNFMHVVEMGIVPCTDTIL